ncbi:MAG: hypothetical protein ACYDDA_07730 [Acidiferrobacteraceae bacterium]
MMLRSPTTEQQLIDQFLDALRALPEVEVERHQREPVGWVGGWGRPDAQIDLQVAGKPLTLLIEAKKAIYPRDVRQVLGQLKEFSRSMPAKPGDGTVSFLIAESISTGAKQLLREERMAYYDSGGSLYLPAYGAYLYIDKPPPKALSKSTRSLFSERRAQVLHTLLMRHQNWFGGKELAAQALVSPATASQVLTALERFDWLASRGLGPHKERHLREPAALLDAWVQQVASIRPPVPRRYFVPSMRIEFLLEQIGQIFDAHEVGYAISHEAAAQRYAPFLSSISHVRCRLLAGPNADAALSALGARVVHEGANLAIIDTQSPGELLFRERVGGIWLASPIQVYLDLLRSEGRAPEMAEHLRKERIGF